MDPELRCPRCNDAMQKRVAQPKPGARTITADYCAGCATMFFDEHELAEVSQALVRARYRAMLGEGLVEGAGERPACPRCSTRGEAGLKSVDVLGVTLDLCLTCKGMLFDAGEYEALALAVAQAGAEPRAGDYRTAPQARKAGNADSVECARCGDPTQRGDAMIVPAGLVCARCYYAFEEPSLEAGQGDSELRKYMLRDRLEGPVLHPDLTAGRVLLGVLGGIFGPRYCSRCGRPSGSCSH